MSDKPRVKYLIVYDLRGRGRSKADYKSMDEFLTNELEAQRILDSKWVAELEDGPDDILGWIKDQKFFKDGDGLFVCALIELGGESTTFSSFGLIPTDFNNL